MVWYIGAGRFYKKFRARVGINEPWTQLSDQLKKGIILREIDKNYKTEEMENAKTNYPGFDIIQLSSIKTHLGFSLHCSASETWML